MTNQQNLHKAVVSAVLSQLDNGITLAEIQNYFETSAKGLKLSLAFRPSIADFKSNMMAEIQ